MIRITGKLADGTPFLLLGLDDENIKRLTGGKPILVKGETVHMDGDVIIVHGATLKDVKDTVREAGIPLPVEN